MQIVVIIVFASIMGLAVPTAPRLMAAPWPLVAAMAAAHLAVTALISFVGCKNALAGLDGGYSYASAMKGYKKSASLAQAWMAGSMVLLVLIGASDQLASLPLMGFPLLSQLVLLGLFLVTLICHWRLVYPFEQACRMQVEQDLMMAGYPVRRGWTASEYLEFNLRHQFLFVAAPLGLIMLLHELVGAVASLMSLDAGVAGTLRMAAVAVVFFVSPVLLVSVWKTRELANGELRQRLQRLCDKIGLSYRRILVWETGGVLANAAVMGLHRSVRYILISDALLEQLTDDQIVSVFGHEAGHIRRRHMVMFVLFIVASSLVCAALGSLAGSAAAAAGANNDTALLADELVMTASLAGLFWLGFGALSRTLERQADVFGSQCAGLDAEAAGQLPEPLDLPPGLPASVRRFAHGSQIFISALEAIARINGMPREGRNWRHGSIARRVNFLWRWRSDCYDAESFDRSIAAVWLYLLVLLAAGMLGAFALM